VDILLVSSEVPLPGEAGSPRTYHLAQKIAARNPITLLLISDQPEAEQEAKKYLFKDSPFSSATALPVRQSLASLSGKMLNAVSGNPWFITRVKRRPEFRVARRTARALSQNAQVVWVDGLSALQYIEGCAAPIVLDEVDYISRLSFARARDSAPVPRKALNYGRSFLARRYERRHLSRVDCVTLISELDAAAMFHDIGIQVSVVANGCDTDYYRPVAEAAELRGDPALVFVGNFGYPPNRDAAHYIMGEIAQAVTKAFPRARLYLVGPPPPDGFRDVPPCVEAVGFVKDVRDYYAGADVFLCPLRTGAGIKNKMLEAGAMGCAIVASDVSVEGIAFEDRVHFLRAATAADYAEKIAELVAGGGTYGRILGANARDAVERNYSWTREAEKMESLLISAAGGQRRQ
jgi:glycosyltransferase involved in cell wall biosynthesis